jgi:hypothetical protein
MKENSSYFTFLKKVSLWDRCATCVPPLLILNHMTDFQEIWWERYATGSYPDAVPNMQ